MASIKLTYDAQVATPFHINARRIFSQFGAEIQAWTLQPDAQPHNKPILLHGIDLADNIFTTEYLPGRTQNVGMGNDTDVSDNRFDAVAETSRNDDYQELFNKAGWVQTLTMKEEGFFWQAKAGKWVHGTQPLQVDTKAVKGGIMLKKKQVIIPSPFFWLSFYHKYLSCYNIFCHITIRYCYDTTSYCYNTTYIVLLPQNMSFYDTCILLFILQTTRTIMESVLETAKKLPISATKSTAKETTQPTVRPSQVTSAKQRDSVLKTTEDEGDEDEDEEEEEDEDDEEEEEHDSDQEFARENESDFEQAPPLTQKPESRGRLHKAPAKWSPSVPSGTGMSSGAPARSTSAVVAPTTNKVYKVARSKAVAKKPPTAGRRKK